MAIGPAIALAAVLTHAPWWMGMVGWAMFPAALMGLLRQILPDPAASRSAVPGDAIVTAIADTGTTINDRPVFRFTIEVELAGRDGYPATVDSAPPRVMAAAGAIRPGMWLPVRADPARPAEVSIEWSIMEHLPARGLEPGLPPPVLAARLFAHARDQYQRQRATTADVCTLTLTPGLARQLGIQPAQGLLLLHVPPGGAEARAGMAAGDVVVTTGGQPVRTPEDVAAVVNPRPRGEWIPVTLIRDGRTVALSVEKDF